MQLNVSNNINFQSRNQTIRFADDIMRKVKSNYPLISPTYVACYKNYNFVSPLDRKLNKQITNVRREITGTFDERANFQNKALGIVSPIMIYNTGNCGEFAMLSCLTAKINGLIDCYPAILRNQYLGDFDHSVLYVEGKKPYIIDAWLGFTDYVSNAVTRYKNEFEKFFDNMQDRYKIRFVKQNNRYAEFLNSIKTPEQIDELRHLFPELIIKKK